MRICLTNWATLLHQLALDGSVRIVATVRSGETVPDAITSLWKDGYLQRLHLMPSTKAQCVTLIESALCGRVEGLSADLMWESSGGNALFVKHLVEGALEAGTLRQVRGVWQLRGRTAVTSELASLLDSRVDQLPDNVLHALRLLTFCEPLGLDTLAASAGSTPPRRPVEEHNDGVRRSASTRARRSASTRARRRFRHRRTAICGHRAHHIGWSVPGMGDGQRARRHR
jgi:hypothetical protein